MYSLQPSARWPTKVVLRSVHANGQEGDFTMQHTCATLYPFHGICRASDASRRDLTYVGSLACAYYVRQQDQKWFALPPLPPPNLEVEIAR